MILQLTQVRVIIGDAWISAVGNMCCSRTSSSEHASLLSQQHDLQTRTICRHLLPNMHRWKLRDTPCNNKERDTKVDI